MESVRGYAEARPAIPEYPAKRRRRGEKLLFVVSSRLKKVPENALSPGFPDDKTKPSYYRFTFWSISRLDSVSTFLARARNRS
jgi:hypothetical protein